MRRLWPLIHRIDIVPPQVQGAPFTNYSSQYRFILLVNYGAFKIIKKIESRFIFRDKLVRDRERYAPVVYDVRE